MSPSPKQSSLASQAQHQISNLGTNVSCILYWLFGHCSMPNSRLLHAHVNLFELGRGKGHVLHAVQTLFLFVHTPFSPTAQYDCMPHLVNKSFYEELESEGLDAEGLKDLFPGEFL